MCPRATCSLLCPRLVLRGSPCITGCSLLSAAGWSSCRTGVARQSAPSDRPVCMSVRQVMSSTGSEESQPTPGTPTSEPDIDKASPSEILVRDRCPETCRPVTCVGFLFCVPAVSCFHIPCHMFHACLMSHFHISCSMSIHVPCPCLMYESIGHVPRYVCILMHVSWSYRVERNR